MLSFLKENTALRRQTCQIDRFISLAGIFDIPTHYRVEAERYIERLSPMSPTCADISSSRLGSTPGTAGWTPHRTLKNWKKNSPSRIIVDNPLSTEELPDLTLLVHGELDTTVPATSSEKYYMKFTNIFGHGGPKENSRKNTNLHVLPGVGHVDVVLHLMFGGETLDLIFSYLCNDDDGIVTTNMAQESVTTESTADSIFQ